MLAPLWENRIGCVLFKNEIFTIFILFDNRHVGTMFLCAGPCWSNPENHPLESQQQRPQSHSDDFQPLRDIWFTTYSEMYVWGALIQIQTIHFNWRTNRKREKMRALHTLVKTNNIFFTVLIFIRLLSGIASISQSGCILHLDDIYLVQRV